MSLQVQPLKVLATREVVTKRLDYSTYLNGTTKDELDGLGRLAGNYKIHASKITIGAVNALGWFFLRQAGKCLIGSVSRKLMRAP